MATLSVQNLSKKDGHGYHLSNLSFKVNLGGETVLITGPTNSGKNMLKNIIIGKEQDWEGTVELNNSCIRKRTESVVVVDHPIKSSHKGLLLKDYLSIPLKLEGIKQEEIHKKIERIAEVFQFSDLINCKIEKLSIVHLIKAKLIRAYLAKPSLIIIDQPFYQLCLTERLEVLSAIKEVSTFWENISIIVISQYIKEWLNFCDRFVIIYEGAIQQIGDRHEIHQFPNNQFVASFIFGNKFSFLVGRIENEKFMSKGLTFALPKSIIEEYNLCNIKDIVLGIPPNRFTLSDSCIPPLDVEFHVPIFVIENGKETDYLYTNIGGQSVIAEFKKNDRIKEGILIKIGFLLNDILLFDGKTKTRLKKGLIKHGK